MTRRLIFALLLLCMAIPSLPAQTRGPLDTTTFVVVGEGLAAGMANYGLSREVQEWSFPAQIGRQIGTIFPQPLIQGPGLETMFGLALPAAIVPRYPQTTARVFPVNPEKKAGEVDGPTLFVFNLSLPNWRVADSLSVRPKRPLIQSWNPRQTTVNLILGLPALILENEIPLWTQLEYAKAMNPTFAMVELGYFEALEAAAAGNAGLIPDEATFRANYSAIVKGLRSTFAEVVVMTIPDPVGAAYFVSPSSAARLLQTDVSTLTSRYGIEAGDFITRTGLYAIGSQSLKGAAGPLPAGSVLKAATAGEIRSRVHLLNGVISGVAKESGSLVHDLNGFSRVLRETGMEAAGKRLTGEYLGGFYSLDGVYPSITGHGLIANDVLRLLNTAYNRSFPLVDLAPLVARDPAAAIRVAE